MKLISPRHFILGFAAVTTALALQAAPVSLAERWAVLHEKSPKLHLRDAAQQLGVSEAELLATDLGKTVTRLRDGKDAARDILTRLPELGEITALTRNDNVVLERTAVSEKPRFREDGESGLVTGPIDLRIALKIWRTAFAVVQPGREGKISRSLQFFDAHGTAIHKIYVKNEAGVPVFDKIVADFRSTEQTASLAIEPVASIPADKPDAEIDQVALLTAWRGLTDVHQFSGVLKKLGVAREQALRLGSPEFAEKIAPAAARAFLEKAAADQTPFLAFVSNDGMTQIFTGKIHKVAPSSGGEWFNVLDPDFNLHLRASSIASAWLVKKPTKDGDLTSLEIFDAQGRLIVQFYPQRERGQPEPETWRALLAALPRKSV